MAKSFAITTTATDTLRADAQGHAEAGFTVTNTTSRPIRGLAKARPLGDTKQQWLTVQGEAERDFAAGATQQFTVSFDGPATEPASGTPPGSTAPPAGTPAAPVARKYPFRLDVESALNPEEDFTEGPTVTVEMEAAAAPAPKKFPLWIIFVILGVLLLIGIIILVIVLTRDKQDGKQNGESPSPSPVVSPKPAGKFEGKWKNADPNTRGITRLVIEQNRGQLSVHPFGSCTPQDCDWGVEKGAVVGNEGRVTFDQGFVLRKLVLTLQGDNELKLVEDAVFNDSRPRQHNEYVFNRQP